MPLRHYKSTRFSEDRLDLIRKANQTIQYYQTLGHTLTLRQLYYRWVCVS